jgi:PadR family transcriptional regulator, regulatory protein PadR
MSGEMLKGHLDLLLLSIVSKGPAHGYAIIEQLKVRSNGRFDLAEGTVYPALHRLEELELVRSRWATPTEGSRRRRVYELTARGRKALTARASEWQSFIEGIHSVLGGGPWPTTS